jgi:hypothetical protein
MSNVLAQTQALAFGETLAEGTPAALAPFTMNVGKFPII